MPTGPFMAYGSYQHPPNEVAFTVSKEVLRRGTLRIGVKETWHITGLLMAANHTDLQTAIEALDAAYRLDGQNLQFFLNDGTTVGRSLLSAQTDSGVMIEQGPEYPEDGRGSNEYGVFRTYSIVASAKTTGGSDKLPQDTLVWQETLSITGTGDPQFVLPPVLNTVWPVQTLRTNTSVHAVQSGSAVGRSRFPTFPAPLFGAWEHREQRKRDKGPVKRDGPVGHPCYNEWPVAWAYCFESPTSLTGSPNLPPG